MDIHITFDSYVIWQIKQLCGKTGNNTSINSHVSNANKACVTTSVFPRTESDAERKPHP